MIPWLADTEVDFPPVHTALDEPNGLLAAGGNLSTSTLLKAYQSGIFPWYNAPDPILWWSPDPRTVLIPGNIHISGSMKKVLRKNPFTITCDKAFKEVMRGCAGIRNYTDQTWISQEIIEAYFQLHQQGFAHSIEAWQDSELVGGVYGVAIGCMFYGESMFSKKPNASKTAFIKLAQMLEHCGFELIDCQVHSEHLETLGACKIPRNEFLQLLNKLTVMQPKASPWDTLNHHE